ncbi:MAG: aryl-sulfate sulfotransferase [Cyclobacteriaceae bacterium]
MKLRARGFVMIVMLLLVFSHSAAQKIAGPTILQPGIADGYTLFAPLTSNVSYLIDNCGRVINKWESDFLPGNTVYLMPNGNLLRTIKLPNVAIAGGGGSGGVELFDWSGTLLWSFELNTDLLRLHHDVSYLPNGNILMIVWEVRNESEQLDAGRDPLKIPPNGLIWSERIIEVKPIFPNSAEIVWKWSAWDHLTQDFDNSKAGFGVVSEHPELINVNYVSNVTTDWIHANSIDYNEELDQIVLSSPFFNELWIIDHSTTTEQAASHSGGISGKGGDLLYRWGNPITYGRGLTPDQRLFFQHDVNWIEEGPHQGKILLFNNNKGEGYSSVDVINPPLNTNGKIYEIGTGAFGPISSELEYTDDPKENFYSQNMAGAQFLSNGNLLICSSRQGFFFEVNPLTGEKVWQYRSPITGSGIVGRDFFTDDPDFGNDILFRAQKYKLDYPAFDGKVLTPMEPIEGEPWAPCDLVTSIVEESEMVLSIYPNPVRNLFVIQSSNPEELLNATVLSIFGQIIISKSGKGRLEIDASKLSSGIFLINVNNKSYKLLKTD